MRGTVLSISVLAVCAGIGMAASGLVQVHPSDPGLFHLIELALILTLFSDGLLVERELLSHHWTPAARALALAMPATMGLMAVVAKLLFGDLSWAEAFLLAAVLAPTDPVITSSIVGSTRVPAEVRHTLNLESGLNDGLALPFVLFFVIFASPTGDAAPEGARLIGEAAFGAVVGMAVGVLGGRLARVRIRGGITSRYEGIYGIGLGLTAYGLADVTFGNGLIAAFVTGIALGASEHRVPEGAVEFAEKLSSIFQALTFFAFGALVWAVGYHGSIPALLAFIVFAVFVARPVAVVAALAGTRIPMPHKAFMGWFGPKGVASMLFALYVLDSQVGHGHVVFDVAAFTILASIAAHGLTDTIGAGWIERRSRG
jgi:NhaP-type Na+/H+ or K+/H+ antiporter